MPQKYQNDPTISCSIELTYKAGDRRQRKSKRDGVEEALKSKKV
jgi:hypothetical protein